MTNNLQIHIDNESFYDMLFSVYTDRLYLN